jgi:hypothetical protein
MRAVSWGFGAVSVMGWPVACGADRPRPAF